MNGLEHWTDSAGIAVSSVILTVISLRQNIARSEGKNKHDAENTPKHFAADMSCPADTLSWHLLEVQPTFGLNPDPYGMFHLLRTFPLHSDILNIKDCLNADPKAS